MSGLGLSFRFEFIRTLRKPTFWFATLVLPAMAVVIGLLVTASPPSASDADDPIAFTYSDPAGLIDAEVADQLGGTLASNARERQVARDAATDRAYFVFSERQGAPAVTVYGPHRGLTSDADYGQLATTLVRESALRTVTDPAVRASLTSTVPVDVQTADASGSTARTPGQIIPPMLFAAALFTIMVISGNRMLVSTLEEKENRVIEMILVGIRPLDFIGGKILALFALTGVQIGVILVPSLAIAAQLRDQPALRFLADVRLELQAGPLLVAALLLIGALALFTGILVAIGSLSTSAKDAGPYFGGFLILMVLPVYSITTLLTDPSAPLIQAFLYFPMTTPITALVLNAMGNLSTVQAVGAVIELVVVGAAAVVFAARLFQRGALDAPPIRLPRLTQHASGQRASR